MKKMNEYGGSTIKTLLVLVVVGIIGGASFYVYITNKKTQDNLNNAGKSSVVDVTKEDKQEPKLDELDKSIPNDDDMVLGAARDYCAAELSTGTKFPRELTVGTQAPNDAKIAYTTDKIFARLNVNCHDKGQVPQGGVAYVLKKVNSRWIVIGVGQQGDPQANVKYGIPPDFNP